MINPIKAAEARDMSSRKRFQWYLKPVLAGAALLLAAPAATWADPPPWAPATGQQAVHQFTAQVQPYDEAAYMQNTRDYGIAQSTCNREAMSSLIGGSAASQAGAGAGQMVAATAGSVVGMIVGNSIGAQMDELDQACTGQALERAEDYQAVSWSNPNTGAKYNVALTGIYVKNNRFCRGYVARIIIGNEIDTVEGQACRDPDGTWRKAG